MQILFFYIVLFQEKFLKAETFLILSLSVEALIRSF